LTPTTFRCFVNGHISRALQRAHLTDKMAYLGDGRLQFIGVTVYRPASPCHTSLACSPSSVAMRYCE